MARLKRQSNNGLEILIARIIRIIAREDWMAT
jgi:hypothetical protein